MARINASMFAFNRGEVSKAALARVDNERLRLAAECQLNWLPTVIGEMTLRPGLQMINEVYADAAGIMIPFIYAKPDTAIIELTPNIMRIEIGGVLVARVAVGTAVSDPTFQGAGSWSTADTAAGCSVTIGSGLASLVATAVAGLARIKQTLTIAAPDQGKEHGLRIVVTSGPVTVRAGSQAGFSDYIEQTELDTGTHSLAMTPTGGSVFLEIDSTDQWTKTLSSVSIEAAGTLTLPTPWSSAVLSSLRWTQSGDVIYVAGYGMQQYKIERRGARPGARGWSIALYRSVAGPFIGVPSSAALLTIGACFGSTTLSASQPFFQPGHVGALFQVFSQGQGGVLAVLAGTSSFSPAIRVAGVGGDRALAIQTAGTWAGTLQIQRSYVGPDSGFVDVAQDNNTTPNSGSFTGNINYSGATVWSDALNQANSTTSKNLGLDNVIVWYRIAFTAYTSGSATISFGYTGGGTWGICRVTGYISPTLVAVDILQNFSGPTPSDNWQESEWSGVQGWPTSVGFFEGRLGWAGQDQFWLSQSDNYTGYAVQDSQGNDLGDAAAIIETFGSGPADTVNWLLPLTRLLCGREQSIESVRSSSFDQVLTPSTVSTKPCATHGAARAKAIQLDTSGIFIEESGSRVYKLQFSPQAMDYTAVDLTRLNTDIAEPGFTDIAVQRQRDTHIWLPKTDGQAAVLLDEAAEEINAWWRVQTLGVIENVCVLPAPSGPENMVFLTVRRVINGVTRRFREQLAPRLNCIGGTINQLFDCHYLYEGVAVSSVQAAWLPGTQVGVWADGSYLGLATSDGSGNVAMPDGNPHSNIVVGLLGQVYSANAAPASYAPVSSVAVPAAYNGFPAEVFADGRRIGVVTVSGGAITLPGGRTAQAITACVGYVAPFMSAKLSYAAEGGTAINQRKKLDHVGLLLLNTSSQGLTMGQRMDLLDPLPPIDQDTATPAGTIWDQYDQQMQEAPGQWDTDARLCMLGAAPYPVTVNGVVIAVTTNG